MQIYMPASNMLWIKNKNVLVAFVNFKVMDSSKHVLALRPAVLFIYFVVWRLHIFDRKQKRRVHFVRNDTSMDLQATLWAHFPPLN